MSDNVIGIIGGTIGIGQYIINDYVITITETEGEYGYTMTVVRGDEVQTISLYGLTPEQYNTMIGYLEQAQAAAQSASESESQAEAFMNVAIDAANRANTQASRASGFANTAQSYAWQAQQSEAAAKSAKDAAVAAKTDAQTAAASAASSRDAAQAAATEAGTAKAAAETAQAAAETAETNAQTYAGHASTRATDAAQSAASAAQTLAQVQAEGQAQIAAIDAEGQRVLDSIPADYSQMTEDVADLKSQMSVVDSVALGAYPTGSASGSIVAFADGAEDLPLKAMSVDIRSETGVTGTTITHRGKNVFDQALMRDQAGWNIIKFYAPVGTTLTMATDMPTDNGLLVYFRQAGVTTLGNQMKVHSVHPVTYAVNDAGYMEIVQRRASGEDSFANYQYQIEVGDTATDWEPYAGAEYVIDWADIAGAVTAGTLDAVGGVLTVGSDVYQVSPVDVRTLRGDNTLWADCGDVAVTWRADPTLYADKCTSATHSLIAGVEPTMTASKAYTTGQLLIVGDTLYKVAASIASGATLTPGTNVTQTTVAEQLLLLANA